MIVVGMITSLYLVIGCLFVAYSLLLKMDGLRETVTTWKRQYNVFWPDWKAIMFFSAVIVLVWPVFIAGYFSES